MASPPASSDAGANLVARPRSALDILGRVAPYLLRHRTVAAANFACAALALGFSLAFPQIIQHIIDDVIAPARADLLLPAVLVLAAAFLLRAVFTALRIVANNVFEQNVILDMRRDLYARLQLLPVGFFDRSAAGDLMTRLNDDVVAVERIVIDGSEQGAIALLSVAAVFAILCAKNGELALLALIPLPLLAAAIASYSIMSVQQFRALRGAMSTLNMLLLDNLQGIRQIKLFNRQPHENARFAERAGALRRRALAVLAAWAAYSPGIALIGSLGTVLVVWRGGAMAMAGQMTLGELVGFLFYLTLFYEPIGQLQGLNQILQSARAAGERVFDIMDTEAERAPSGDGALAAPVRGEVRYENVGFSHAADRPVLSDISLSARPGEMVALVGPTGAGKSTLVSLLPGFYRPDRGRITIDAQDIAGISLAALREAIAVVTQEAFLFNGTLRENLLYGRLEASEAEMVDAATAANCHDFISRLPQGYDTPVGERGVRLSVGERQRISIARALLKNAPILILDEATASVDTATETLIQQALDRLMANRTCLVIAHRLTTIRHAHQILVLVDGAIVERGTHDSLLALGGTYARLWRIRSNDLLEDAVAHDPVPPG